MGFQSLYGFKKFFSVLDNLTPCLNLTVTGFPEVQKIFVLYFLKLINQLYTEVEYICGEKWICTIKIWINITKNVRQFLQNELSNTPQIQKLGPQNVKLFQTFFIILLKCQKDKKQRQRRTKDKSVKNINDKINNSNNVRCVWIHYLVVDSVNSMLNKIFICMYLSSKICYDVIYTFNL